MDWIDLYLQIMRDEYAKDPPAYSFQKATKKDLQYIEKNSKLEDPFDTYGMKKESYLAFQKGNARLIKCVSEYGEILILSMDNSPFEPQWNTWWRAVRLLSPKKKVRILMYGHPKKREFPSEGPIGPEHINGGSAYRCDPGSILIYRKEEATRVLLHELLHASCSDPYYKDTPYIEADTEAWAEILLCGMEARGDLALWKTLFGKQISWAKGQTEVLEKRYFVKTPESYAWRYTIGRLEVWKMLGIDVEGYKPSKANSLRLTLCEPKNT
jgi:hypothetical protein